MQLAVRLFGVAIVGLAVGWAAAGWMQRSAKVDYGPTQWDFAASDSPLPASVERRPRVTIEGGPEYHFGSMAFEQTQTHAFKISNIGNEPLELELVDTTCKCTVGELEADEIPPGDTRDVKLTWTVSGYDPEFRQSATIKTNDPDTPTITLAVSGRVVMAVRPDPAKLVWSDLSVSGGREQQLVIYGYRTAELQVAEWQFTEAATRDFFEVKSELLSADDVRQEKDALSGVRLRIQVRPGLPLGPLRQSIVVRTNQPEVAPLTVPIEGNVGSDLSFVGGRNFNRDLNLVHMGQVPVEKGHEVALKLLAKGPFRRDLQIAVQSIDPEGVLQVELGPPTDVNQGAVVSYPLTLRIPPGSPVVDRHGIDLQRVGKVVLTTTHPAAKELTLYVSFLTVK